MVIFLCKLHGKNLGATTSMFDNSVCLKPLSHWTATVLRQLATDIASGSHSSLETVESKS